MEIRTNVALMNAIANAEEIIEIPSGKIFACDAIVHPCKLIIHEGAAVFINSEAIRCNKGTSISFLNGYTEED